MTTPALRQTQQLLWKLVTAPEGAGAGLAALSAAERVVADTLVRGDARLSAVERIDIYADMYFYRLRDCLQEQYPALHAVVGATHFHNLVTDYLLVHPPTHFSLRYAGRHLPGFVAAHALLSTWPHLADLAGLEWAILETFDAEDAPVLAATALAAVPPERWPALRLVPVPALQILRLQWPVHAVWQQVQDGQAPQMPLAGAICLRVWRRDLRVYHQPIDTHEAAALEALLAGASFATVCERLAETGDDTAGATRALALLREWLNDGVLSGFGVD